MSIDIIFGQKLSPTERAIAERFWCTDTSQFPQAESRADRSPCVANYYAVKDSEIIGRMGVYSAANLLTQRKEVYYHQITMESDDPGYGKTIFSERLLSNLPAWVFQCHYLADVVIFHEAERCRGHGTRLVSEALRAFSTQTNAGGVAVGLTASEYMMKIFHALSGTQHTEDLLLSFREGASQEWFKFIDIHFHDGLVMKSMIKQRTPAVEKNVFPYWWRQISIRESYNSPICFTLILDMRTSRFIAYIVPERNVKGIGTVTSLGQLEGQMVAFLDPTLKGKEVTEIIPFLKHLLCSHRWSSIIQIGGAKHRQSIQLPEDMQMDKDMNIFHIPFSDVLH